MMIGKSSVADDRKFPVAEIAEESGGITDGTEGEKFSSRRRSIGAPVMVRNERGKPSEIQGGIVNRSRGVAPDNCFYRRGVFASRNDDNVGALEGGSWLAKTARRQNVASAEWVCRVYQEYVEIPGERKMLESVVENEPVEAGLRQFGAGGEAVRTYADGEEGFSFGVFCEFALHDASFVTEARRHFRRFLNLVLPMAAQNSAESAAVAAGKNRDVLPSIQKIPSEPDDERGLTGAAERQIADADDDAREAARARDSLSIAPGAQAREDFIRYGKREQHGAI